MKGFHYFDLGQQVLRKYSESHDRQLKSKLFTKYFPKYHKEFVMTNKNGAIQSKIKGAKIINSFKIATSIKKRSFWRPLLANRMKSVRTLTNNVESAKIFAEKIKFFSGLQSVQISMGFLRRSHFPSQDNNKQLELSFSKACKNIGRLRNLKHLEATPFSIGANKCFTRLNAHKKLLDSLKTLKTFFDWTGASDDEISEMIEKNMNFLRNVTSLKLATLSSHFHFESFQRLRELCSKITKLEFEFGCQDMGLPDEKTNYLQTLGAFHHLRTLNLVIHDAFTLLKDFVLPPSIHSLSLKFDECLSKEIMIRIDDKFVDSDLSMILEENSLFQRFYDNFKRLEHLEALELIFAMDSHNEAYKYQNYLFQSLLKRISSPLKHLVITPAIPFGQINQIPEVLDSSLPQLIELCEKFATTLKTLRIGCSRVIYSNFDLSAYWHKFKNLSEVSLSARFYQSLDSFGSFLQNFLSLGESISFFTLEIFIKRNAEALLSVLKQLNEVKRPNKLKMRLFLDLQNVRKSEGESMSFADGTKKLQGNEKCYSKVKGVVFNYAGYSMDFEFLPFMTLYQERFVK